MSENANVSLDAPETTADRRRVIERKRLLRTFYDDAYRWMATQSESPPRGVRVELGSGAGYLKRFIPNLVTSDVMPLPFVDMTIDAASLPFGDGTVAAIYMIDTLHHIPRAERFFAEASRVLVSGGRIIMQEPANSAFGRFIYRNFHHEPFEPSAVRWDFPSNGPLSSANGALPWIVFERDASLFREKFPDLRIVGIEYRHPLLYLLSGGFSIRQLLPNFAAGAVVALEKALRPFDRKLGLFMRIVVEKRSL